MMDAPSPLERRLRERRYHEGSRACIKILDGLGIEASEQHVFPMDEVETIWHRYLTRLRENSAAAERWPADEHGAVQARLDEFSDALGSVRVVWLSLVDSEPVAVGVFAGELLRAALTYFVTSAGDLMLTTRDANDGICVELNHLHTGDEYEVVAWGDFAV